MAQVVGIAATYVEVWEEVSALLGELDVLAGFAELAACAPTPYVRPTMLPSGEGELVLRGAPRPAPLPAVMLTLRPARPANTSTASGTRPGAARSFQ